MAIQKIQMKPEGTNDYADVLHPETSADVVILSDGTTVEAKVSSHLAEYAVQTATGTANAIAIITGGDFKYTQGNKISFKAMSNSTSAVTVNIDNKGNKALKKLDGTNATVKSNKVYEIFYSAGDDCFFLLASAEGDAVAGNVLAGKTFSNDDDSGILGTMPNRGTLNQTITSNNGQISLSSGYYTGGAIKAAFANLIAGNVKSGVNIGGVVGNLTPSAVSAVTYSRTTVPGSRTFYMGSNQSVIIVMAISGSGAIEYLSSCVRGVGYAQSISNFRFSTSGTSTSLSIQCPNPNYQNEEVWVFTA